MLDKFYIGDLDRGEEEGIVKYMDKNNQFQFYKTLKARADKYFVDSKVWHVLRLAPLTTNP